MAKNNKPITESAGIITLQWLTYLFWGLAVLATNILVSVLVSFWVMPRFSESSESVAYAVAASLIVMPIAFVCDVFFSKREDNLKSPIASIGRVVFTIIYALASLGGLVSLVFNLINIVLNGTTGNDIWVAIATSATVFIAYLLLFVRVIRPHFVNWWRAFYRLFVALTVLIIAGLAIAGPVADAIKTRQDRALRSSMEFVVNSIRDNVNSGRPLPKNVDEAISAAPNYLYSQAQANNSKDFAMKNIIIYTPDSKPATSSDGSITYYYQICGVFEYDSNVREGGSSPIKSDTAYSEYLDFGQIKAGKTCYNISTTFYKNSNK